MENKTVPNCASSDPEPLIPGSGDTPALVWDISDGPQAMGTAVAPRPPREGPSQGCGVQQTQTNPAPAPTGPGSGHLPNLPQPPSLARLPAATCAGALSKTGFTVSPGASSALALALRASRTRLTQSPGWSGRTILGIQPKQGPKTWGPQGCSHLDHWLWKRRKTSPSITCSWSKPCTEQENGSLQFPTGNAHHGGFCRPLPTSTAASPAQPRPTLRGPGWVLTSGSSRCHPRRIPRDWSLLGWAEPLRRQMRCLHPAAVTLEMPLSQGWQTPRGGFAQEGRGWQGSRRHPWEQQTRGTWGCHPWDARNRARHGGAVTLRQRGEVQKISCHPPRPRASHPSRHGWGN